MDDCEDHLHVVIPGGPKAVGHVPSSMGFWRQFVDGTASKLAFFPPQPPTYKLQQHTDGGREYYIQPKDPGMPKVLAAEVVKLQTKPYKGLGGGSEIVAAFLAYKKARPTLLFSHGNAVDLGIMLPFLKHLAYQLSVNLLAYDYSGYGESTGEPSPSGCYSDIQACWDYLTQERGFKPEEIVLYGQSVGSGPTGHLAARQPKLKGCVFHSGIVSGVRCLKPTWKSWPSWLDVFPNHTNAPRIEACTLVMHGEIDDVVPFSHGQQLHKLLKHPFPPLFSPTADHQNLEDDPQFMPKLNDFMQHLFGADYSRNSKF